MSKLRIWNFAKGKKLLLNCLVALCCLVWSSGCNRSSEPPLNLEKGDSNGQTRTTKLTDLSQRDNTVTYALEYPGYGLASIAKLDFSTAALLEETFSGKWVVLYEYQDIRNKALKLPNRIVIHKFASGASSVGEKLNDYTLSGMPKNGVATYVGASGRRREIHVAYFNVAPGPMGGGLPFR